MSFQYNCVVFYLLFVMVEKLGHKEWWKWLSRALKTATTIFALAAILHIPLSALSQNKKHQDKKIDNKPYENNVAEWKKMEKLQAAFQHGKYGSEYVMGIFDWQFVWPNHRTDFGIRNYTTAYEYLIFGRNLMALLVNLWFDANNIRFIPASKVEWMQSYTLGCIKYYGYSEEALKKDIDGKPADKDQETWVVKNLTIVPGEVKVDLAALEAEEIVGKEKEIKRVLLPQIKNTGSFKDANDFNLAYNWMETIRNNLKWEYDISKRQFSSHTPPVVRDFVLKHFDSKKYIDQYNQRNETQIKKDDPAYDALISPDLISMSNVTKISFWWDLPTPEEIAQIPPQTVVTCGRYQVFRYFTDVYRRELEYQVYEDKLSWSKKIWIYNNGQNPYRHNAFQYDADPDCDSTGISNWILLNYWSQNRQMPTLVPKTKPIMTGRPDVKLVNQGEKHWDYAGRKNIELQTINGRMLDVNFYEYAFEQWILPLNDDGTVEHIYRVAVGSERDDIFWAYIFCGKKAWVKWGRQGKSFVKAVDLYRQSFPDDVYYQIIDTVDAQKGIDKETEKFIARLEKLETQKEKSLSINARVFLNSTNPNDPNKDILEWADLFFLPNHTAILMPDSLIMPWEIISLHGENDASVIRKKVRLTAFGKTFYMKDIWKFHKENITSFQKWRSQSHVDLLNKSGLPIQDSVTTKILYEGEIFELDSVVDMYSLIKRIDNNITITNQEFHDLDLKVENHKKTVLFPLEDQLQNMEEKLLSDPDYLEEVQWLEENLENTRDQILSSAYYLKNKQQLKDSLQKLKELWLEDSVYSHKKQDLDLRLKKLKEDVLSDHAYQDIKKQLEKIKLERLSDPLYLDKKSQYAKEYTFVDRMEKTKDSLSNKKNNLLYREKWFIEQYLNNLKIRLESVTAEIKSLSIQIEDQEKALLFHKDEEKATIKKDIKVKAKALGRKKQDKETIQKGIKEWQWLLDTKFAGYD